MHSARKQTMRLLSIIPAKNTMGSRIQAGRPAGNGKTAFGKIRKAETQITPWAIMASAIFSKPAMLAPITRLPSWPYFLAAS